MTNTSDRPPPPSFYNSESQAIELVNGIEATKVETRRATRRAPATPEPTPEKTEPETRSEPKPAPEKTETTETDLNYLSLTKADIERFTEAVERRGGRPAYSDWRVVGGVFWKASKVALEKSGQKSRRHPDYQRIFHSSISKLLPQIAENAGTAARARGA
jgi:hypothetical protein